MFEEITATPIVPVPTLMYLTLIYIKCALTTTSLEYLKIVNSLVHSLLVWSYLIMYSLLHNKHDFVLSLEYLHLQSNLISDPRYATIEVIQSLFMHPI